MPVDLLRFPIDLHRQRGEASLLQAPGPLEQALYDIASSRDQPGLLIDTDDPRFDLKLMARGCESGQASDCQSLIRLSQEELNAPLILRIAASHACLAGVQSQCTNLQATEAPDEPSEPHSPDAPIPSKTPGEELP